MHHAARNLKVKVVRKIVAIAKDRGQWILGDARTYNNKSQGHWTALMCVLDLSPSRNLTGEEFDKWQYRMKEVVTELLRVMTLDGMAARGASGITCWHTSASRAHLILIPIFISEFSASEIKGVLNHKNAKACRLM